MIRVILEGSDFSVRRGKATPSRIPGIKTRRYYLKRKGTSGSAGVLDASIAGKIMNVDMAAAMKGGKSMEVNGKEAEAARLAGQRHLGHHEINAVLGKAAKDHPYVRFVTARRVSGANKHRDVVLRVNKHLDTPDKGWRFRPSRGQKRLPPHADGIGSRNSYDLHHPTAGKVAQFYLDRHTGKLSFSHSSPAALPLLPEKKWKLAHTVIKAARRDIPGAKTLNTGLRRGTEIQIQKNRVRAGKGGMKITELPQSRIPGMYGTRQYKIHHSRDRSGKRSSEVVTDDGSLHVSGSHGGKPSGLSFGALRKIYKKVSGKIAAHNTEGRTHLVRRKIQKDEYGSWQVRNSLHKIRPSKP